LSLSAEAAAAAAADIIPNPYPQLLATTTECEPKTDPASCKTWLLLKVLSYQHCSTLTNLLSENCVSLVSEICTKFF